MIYKLACFLGKILSFLFWPIKVKGEKYLSKTGPIILAANHVSYLDPIVLGTAINRQIHFIAKREVFDVPILGIIVKTLGAIPVDRKKASIISIKKSINILKNGKILGIFPEGTRSLNGELLELNVGFIKIALMSNAPIMPVGIHGTYDIYPPGSTIPSFLKRKNIYVNIGKPIHLDNTREKDIKYQKESLLIIERTIKELINSCKAIDT
jgi:1-acyl-sn-glycerol-3-phosphate acyltransferase